MFRKIRTFKNAGKKKKKNKIKEKADKGRREEVNYNKRMSIETVKHKKETEHHKEER